MNTVARLFDFFQPHHYKLRVSMDRKNRTFETSLELTGDLMSDSDTIRLHCQDLEIVSSKIDGQPCKTSIDIGLGELHAQADQSLLAGKHTLEIVAKGKITDPMHGLYPCYFEHDGQKKEILATQFESHHAREVFPCVDEPEAKATFGLTIVTEKGVSTIANTPISDQKEENDQLVTTFETSPKMSTYLLAWVVGELQNKTAKTKDGVTVSVWATPAQKAVTLDFPLDVAVKSIEFYNDYFKVPYPLAKCDLVALPDFSSGAMENWGCITYREVALLVDPNNTSISMKQYVGTVITHELAHQWFGNLVTMRWWDDLWLNESFASMMEYVALDKLFPEWKIWLDFSTQDTLSALRRDKLKGIQAVRTGVNHPDEISTLFDPSIVYAKGAKLMQMLYYYVGDEAWRTGLHNYFAAHKYGNTEANDLWEALGAASGKDVSSFMMPWLERPGYPVVSVAKQGDAYEISQQRFLSNPDDRAQDASAPWPIPLAASQKVSLELFDSESAKLTTEQSDQPLKLNTEDRALFITHYKDKEHRTALKNAVSKGQLSEVDRLQLLHELTLLSSAGVSSQIDVLDFLEAYKHEENESVWGIISIAIYDTRKLVEKDEQATADLKKYVARLIKLQYERLGWDKQPDESSFDTVLRGTILGMGLFAEYQPIVDEGLKRFREFTNPEELPADLRTVIYIAGIKFGGQAEFDKLIGLYQTTDFAEEQQNMAGGLLATRNPEHIKYLLSKLKDPTFVRVQDFARWFVGLLRNRHSRQAMWEWMVQEWDGWIIEKFSTDKSYDMLPRYAASAFITTKDLEQYQAFFAPHAKIPALKRSIEVGIEDIKARAQWFERDAETIAMYLAKQ